MSRQVWLQNGTLRVVVSWDWTVWLIGFAWGPHDVVLHPLPFLTIALENWDRPPGSWGRSQ